MKMKDYEENFLSNIAWIRKYYGISKKNMAKLLKIGVADITCIETGKIPSELSAEIIFIVQKRFGVAPADLLEKQLKNESSP